MRSFGNPIRSAAGITAGLLGAPILERPCIDKDVIFGWSFPNQPSVIDKSQTMKLFTGMFDYQEWGQKSKWRQMWLFVKAGARNCDASANLKIKEVLKVKYFEVKRIIMLKVIYILVR